MRRDIPRKVRIRNTLTAVGMNFAGILTVHANSELEVDMTSYSETQACMLWDSLKKAPFSFEITVLKDEPAPVPTPAEPAPIPAGA